MPVASEYVRQAGANELKVGGSEVSLASVLHAWEAGHSPEAIRSQYPELTLEEVYGAITWMLAHGGEVEAYRQAQEAVWASARQRAAGQEPPVVRRLRAQPGAPADRGG